MLLSISENQLIDELVIGLLAAPQLAIFFEKFPRMKRALMKDIPGWKLKLQQRIQEAKVPPALANEFTLYQRCQLQDSVTFYQQVWEVAENMEKIHSPFATQARSMLEAADLANNPPHGDSLQTLFLQRWRISLTVQTVTLHHQLLEQEREQLLAELQQRLALTGALEPILADNDTAAGRLWDMSQGQLQRGDYQLLLQYGDFLQQQIGRAHV